MFCPRPAAMLPALSRGSEARAGVDPAPKAMSDFGLWIAVGMTATDVLAADKAFTAVVP